MLTAEEAKNVVAFLDRVDIKGHQERNVMNALVQKLVNIASPQPDGQDGSGDPAAD